VYLDMRFFQELRDRFQSPGDFAQAYVVAHEVGHHVQNLVGISDRVNAARPHLPRSQANSLSVRVELQADCLAGVWAADADSRGVLEKGDFEEGIIGLFRVGDPEDAPFDPDAHGTSGQRIDSFTNGFKHGLEACSID
jgi:predicted metalloprotease